MTLPENLPGHIIFTFIITTLVTVFLLYKASGYSTRTILFLLVWMGLQAWISLSGFYTVTDTNPPRVFFLAIPMLVFIVILFFTSYGKKYLDSLDNRILTLLHIIRIPVELVLYALFVFKSVPQLMTFEGRNFDILSGISVPFIFYLGYVKKKICRRIILAWNFICLALLLNIVINAILSLPYPFQKFAFDQPNVAVLYFPFSWLPSVVVPIVLFSHLVCIRSLLKVNNTK